MQLSTAHPAVASPLIIDLHGAGMDATSQRATSGYNRATDAHVVWPEGYGRTWAAGEGTYPPASASGVDHVACLAALSRRIRAAHNVSFVVAAGMSNGCAMAQRLAFEKEGAVDVVACASHGVVVDSRTSDPVDFVLLMGSEDDVWSRGVPRTLRQWTLRNGCARNFSTTPTHDALIRDYACRRGRVRYVVLRRTGHFFFDQANRTLPFIRAHQP